jgi:hypothetical protein
LHQFDDVDFLDLSNLQQLISAADGVVPFVAELINRPHLGRRANLEILEFKQDEDQV